MRTDASASDRASISVLRRLWVLNYLQRTTEFRQRWGFGFPLNSNAWVRPPRSVSMAAVNRPGTTLLGDSDGQGIRRDRHGRALRRLANSDVAGAQGVPRAGGGPGVISERHRLDPSRASPRGECADAVGAG